MCVCVCVCVCHLSFYKHFVLDSFLLIKHIGLSRIGFSFASWKRPLSWKWKKISREVLLNFVISQKMKSVYQILMNVIIFFVEFYTIFFGFSRFGLVSLFNGISTFVGYLIPKAILLEEQYWYYLTHSWEDKGVHTFSKGIWPKVNVIARLEYELAYYNSAVHRFNHYTTRTLPRTVVVLFNL